MNGINSAVPPPNPAAMMPDASPRRSLNHFSADPIDPLYTKAAPMPARQYVPYSIGNEVAYPRPAQPRPHSSPAALMNPRGPRRSISQPSSGWTHVWHRMNN